MSKNFKLQKMIVFLVGFWVLAATCPGQKTIVSVREELFRAEHSLPLDSSEIDSVVEFIADGGVNKKDGFHASIDPQEPFRRLLQFFKSEANLTYGTFSELADLEEFFNMKAPVRDVIDAREAEPAVGNTRLAYRFKDYWFVFVVDKPKVGDTPILDSERQFSRLIVMRALVRTETDK